MPSKQPDPKPQDPPVKLQQLNFQRVQVDDPKVVVYQAEIQDDDTPEKPVWRMTVTAGMPKDEKELKKLEGFMGEMEVGFILTKPHPAVDTGDDQDEPLDVENEILIQHQLVRTALDGPSGATVVVSTAVDGDDPEAAKLAPGLRELAASKKDTVGAKSHRWAAKGGVSTDATATAKKGSGRIRNQKKDSPYTPFKIGTNGKKKGKNVWVVGVGGSCTYLFSGDFNGPFTD